jgi:hypothetical protein
MHPAPAAARRRTGACRARLPHRTVALRPRPRAPRPRSLRPRAPRPRAPRARAPRAVREQGGKRGASAALKVPPAARCALAYPHLALVAGRVAGRPGPSRLPVPARTAVTSLAPPAALPKPRRTKPPLAPTQANRAAHSLPRAALAGNRQPQRAPLPGRRRAPRRSRSVLVQHPKPAPSSP